VEETLNALLAAEADEQGSRVFAIKFRDAPKDWLAARAVLASYWSQPGSKVTATFKGFARADSCQLDCGYHGANA